MKSAGFSLIELLIVLAMIAILASIAIPSYPRYIAKENLKRAQADLEFLSLRLEHRYQRVLAYPITDLASTASIESEVSKWSPTSNADDFTFSTEDSTNNTYTLIATGLSGNLQNCVVSMTHDGIKKITSCSDFAADELWLE